MKILFDCYSCKTLKILHELLVLVFVCLTVCFVLCQDKETGFHRGFCWVGFSSEEGLSNALQKDLHMIEGAKVKKKRISTTSQGLVRIEVFVKAKLSQKGHLGFFFL